jgi:hypothetical protein
MFDDMYCTVHPVYDLMASKVNTPLKHKVPTGVNRSGQLRPDEDLGNFEKSTFRNFAKFRNIWSRQKIRRKKFILRATDFLF